MSQADSLTNTEDSSASTDEEVVALTELGERIRSSTPAELLALADDLDDLARRHEIAHASDVDQDSSTGDDGAGERIRLYPSKLRLAVDSPTENTQATLGNFSHLVETSHDGQASIYQTEQLDIWTSPYDDVENLLDDYSRTVGELPESVERQLRRTWERGEAFRLQTHSDGHTVLRASSTELFEGVAKEHLEHNTHYTQYVGDKAMRIKNGAEADVKQTLYGAGYPPIDERELDAGGEELDVQLEDVDLRDYQREWVNRFCDSGSGVIDAPPGAGKTIAALGVMEAVGRSTLILVPSRELAQQWEDALREHTNLIRYPVGSSYRIGQYHGGEKNIRPVTIATYDIASKSRHGRKLFEEDWGLVIYDECHHSPASVWRRTADIQSRHRLGLTATPVRADGKSEDIFSLIGRPLTSTWEELYREGWVHRPNVEVRFLPWASDSARDRYRGAKGTKKMMAAAENPAKVEDARRLLEEHAGEKMLIYCGWRDQGELFANELDIPFINGDTRHDDREEHYEELRNGDRQALIVSRIADEGIDLPDIDVVIIASMLGGSRRQGAQRVGRVMRPFGGCDAHLLATRGSREEEYARSQMDYLRERGTTVTETEVDA